MFNASITGRKAAAAALAVATFTAGVVGSTPAAYSAPVGDIVGAATGIAIPGRYIVVLKNTKGADDVPTRAKTLSDRYAGKLDSVYEKTLSGFSVAMRESSAKRLAADPEVDYVEQDQVVHLTDTQENPPSPGLDRIDQRALPLDTTFSYESDPSPVTVYVLDSGVRTTHTDFGGRAVNGWDFVDGDAIANDCNGHGTHVAGTIGGTAYGVAKKVKLVAVRAFDCSGVSTASSVQNAVEWITSHAVKPAIANLSIGMSCVDGSGMPTPCPADSGKAVKTAITNSIAAGISYVLSAGNENINACGSPFNLVVGTVVTGAANANDAKRPTSNWGSCVDIWAPGDGIVSAGNAGDTASATMGGTSMAAPHVTGALALILARPGWSTKTPAEVKAQLLSESTPNVVTGLDAGSPNKLVHTPPPPVAGGSSVAFARHADGRLNLFGVNRAGTLFFRTQTAPNADTYTAWTSSVDPSWYSVCADTDSSSRIKLVGLRRNQQVWHRNQAVANTNTWTIWQQFDGLLTSCAVASTGTTLEVFGTNAQGQVWRRSEVSPGGAFTPWTLLAGVPPLRGIAAERNGNGKVELFGLARTGEIWHCWNTAANCPAGSWVQLDGLLTTIAVSWNSPTGLSVFGVNAAGQLFRRDALAGVNTWAAWAPLDSPTTGGPLRSVAAEGNLDGRISLVAVNTAGQIWTRKQTAPTASTYGPWVQLDGLLRP
ncbi:subtilisin family serine protease [Allocatelliglobosispora scoriae]|uniref:Subtilisin family serine protease n=1 Tax=Allocatelliglobosispora scoriae TaxID=643052 RepID=A0A841C0V5_9ACTN|nr:S8 family serine peptidase [Allocatelliglobosispora scoriae]MBB5872783.1 subtilisin family serine protease [Allocatelliglobosispora scoriae]